MASLVDELISVLKIENSEYEILLKISQEKTPVIVKGDIKKLQEITADEQMHCSKIIAAEKKRENVVLDISTVLNIPKEDVSIAALIRALSGQPSEQKRLSEVHDTLKRTLKNFDVINEMNKRLVSESMEMAEFNLNLFRNINSAPETANYNRMATNSYVEQPKFSGFDTKR